MPEKVTKKVTATKKSTVVKKPTTRTKSAKADSPAGKTVDPLLKQLLESGAHFGHRVARWNPKMKPFIYGSRGGVHIIDLTHSYEQLKAAEAFLESVAKTGGKVLFVGTKRQAREILEKAAKATGMPYVTNRWLGGMLTNLETIQSRIVRLKKLQTQVEEDKLDGTKKEKAAANREIEKLSRVFSGIADMQQLPAALFIVDVPREDIATSEAAKLGIPTVAIVDSNANPELVTHPIAGNDDAVKTITLITERIAAAVKRGAEAYQAKAATDAAKQAEADSKLTENIASRTVK